MVTSDEERQGVVTGAPTLLADDGRAEDDAAPGAPEAEAAPMEETLSQAELQDLAAVQPADETLTPEPSAPDQPAPAGAPAGFEPPLASVLDPFASDADPPTEDEATGRRIDSLLAEAPDAHPEGRQPRRGEFPQAEDADELEGFEFTGPIDADDTPSAVDERPAPDSIVSITDPSFFEPPAAPESARSLRGRGMDRVGPIVAFDFDGTLTVRDSFTAFLKWREGSARYHAEMAALAPAALRYLFDRDPGKLKAAAVKRFLTGLPRQVLNDEAMEFAATAAPMLFRPDALRAWRRYRQDGARLLIVTASPENIVAPFARGLGADMLIGTQLIFDQDDRVQGGLLGDNCRGPVKVKRIKEALGDDAVLAAAYGDTDGDWEMLEMAEQQFMRLFVGVPGKPGGAG